MERFATSINRRFFLDSFSYGVNFCMKTPFSGAPLRGGNYRRHFVVDASGVKASLVREFIVMSRDDLGCQPGFQGGHP